MRVRARQDTFPNCRLCSFPATAWPLHSGNPQLMTVLSCKKRGKRDRNGKVSLRGEGTCLGNLSLHRPENMSHRQVRKQLGQANIDNREGQKRNEWEEVDKGVLHVKLEFENDRQLHGVVLKVLKCESRDMGFCPGPATISYTVGLSLCICKMRSLDLRTYRVLSYNSKTLKAKVQETVRTPMAVPQQIHLIFFPYTRQV